MLDEVNLFFPLILLLIVVALILLISFFNKKAMDDFSKNMNNDYTNYKTELKRQNDVFIKQLVSELSLQNNDNNTIKESHPCTKNLMGVFIKLREAIKENCITSMNKIEATRIAIYLFHNGVRSTHGISFLKMSCICEKVAIGSGIRERMMEHTNIPINLFDEMIDKLINNNKYIIINNDEIQETNHKIFISAEKIYYTQLVSIYDINNNILGFVAVEIDRPYSKDEADKEKEVLDELVKQLVPVLSYSDYISIKDH